MYIKKIIVIILLALTMQLIFGQPVWAIKKRLQATHAQRLSKMTLDPLERADFLNY